MDPLKAWFGDEEPQDIAPADAPTSMPGRSAFITGTADKPLPPAPAQQEQPDPLSAWFGEDVAPKPMQGSREFYAPQLTNARAELDAQGPESTPHRAMRAVVQFPHRILSAATYGESLDRIMGRANPTEEDFRNVAMYEKQQQEDAQHSGVASAAYSLAGIPSEAAAFYTGGKIAGAVAPGVGIGSSVARSAIGTAASPNLYAERAIQSNIAAGRNPFDLSGFPEPVALGMVQMGVLNATGSLTHGVLAGPGMARFAGRVGVAGAAGVPSQAITDVVTSAVGLDTGYGLIGDIVKGDGNKALKDAAHTFMTFAAFHGANEAIGGRPGSAKELQQEVMQTFADHLKEQAKKGVPADEAATKTIADLQAGIQAGQANAATPNPGDAATQSGQTPPAGAVPGQAPSGGNGRGAAEPAGVPVAPERPNGGLSGKNKATLGEPEALGEGMHRYPVVGSDGQEVGGVTVTKTGTSLDLMAQGDMTAGQWKSVLRNLKAEYPDATEATFTRTTGPNADKPQTITLRKKFDVSNPEGLKDGINELLNEKPRAPETTDVRGPDTGTESGVRDGVPVGVPESVRPGEAGTGGEEPPAGRPDRPVGTDINPAVAAGTRPHIVDRIAEMVKGGEIPDKKRLFEMADDHWNGKRSDNKYGESDAYDALETGINLALKGETNPTVDAAGAKQQAEQLRSLIEKLPTQTTRTGEKDKLQQFSTPPDYAFAAAWLANVKPGDVALEPSAGVGGIAVHLQNAGIETHANEIDPKRRALIERLGIPTTGENAEQISNISKVQPSVVVMNPPFSSAGDRLNGKKIQAGQLHVNEALKLVADGGRVVAIIGGAKDRVTGEDTKTHQDWIAKLKRQYDVKADVVVDGDSVYRKYGTGYDSRILVIDKPEYPRTHLADVIAESPGLRKGKLVPVRGEDGKVTWTAQPVADESAATITGSVKSIPDLIDKLQGVRDERPQTQASAAQESQAAQRPPAEPVRGEVAPPAGEGTGPGPVTQPPVDAGLAGQPGPAESERPVGRPNGGLGAGVRGTAGQPGESGVAGGQQGTVGERPAGLSLAGEPAAQAPRPTAPGPKGLRRPGAGPGGEPVPRPGDVADVPELANTSARTGSPVSELERIAADAGTRTPKKGELSDVLFEGYKPAVKFAGSKTHPGSLVESSAMASVDLPKITYTPNLPKEAIEKGFWSDAQLEAIALAGDRHQRYLPASEGETKYRQAALIGDGTGVGKGRTFAGIIHDNFNQGRKFAIWVTKNTDLMADATRDWVNTGGNPDQLMDFSSYRKNPRAEGVLVTTYDTLKSKPTDEGAKTNLDFILDQLGDKFDGAINFDEAHMMNNATAAKGKRGQSKAAARALAGVELQAKLPEARVTYASGTVASEVRGLSFADRLGLWGRGTAFPNKQSFIEQIVNGGVGAMEMVARGLKATGRYIARSISFNDGTDKGTVRFSRLVHQLSPDQAASYDRMSDAWQVVLSNIDAAVGHTGGGKDQKKNAMSQFWGANQRFFDSVITSMQVPTLIDAIKKDMANGRSAVIQLTKTGKAGLDKALSERAEDQTLEELNLSPTRILSDYVDRSFPTTQMEEYINEDGKKGTRPALDSNGEPIKNRLAEAMKQKLLDDLASLPPLDGALDQIVQYFGHDKVAEITSRDNRIVLDENGKKVEQRRSQSAKAADSEAFQSGNKRILIFSEAGGTGKSYHADLDADNQEMRHHYLLQPGWKADAAMQGLGRTHRSNQAQAPHYFLMQIDQVPGQKRFISTIARRLAQLGALSKGERRAAGAGGDTGTLFSEADNLESTEAQRALRVLLRDIIGNRVPGMGPNEFERQTGLQLIGSDGNSLENKYEMKDFLNRLLSVKLGQQAQLFNEFETRHAQVVQQAIKEGTLDTGLQTYRADSITKDSEQVVHTDPESGAETKYIKLTTKHKTTPTSFEDIQRLGEMLKDQHKGFITNNRSGRVYMVRDWVDKLDHESGTTTPQYALIGPNSEQYLGRHELDDSRKWTPQPENAAKELWNRDLANVKPYTEKPLHIVTGAVLPVFDRLPAGGRVLRLQTDAGEVMLGKEIENSAISRTLNSLGASADAPKIESAELHSKVLGGEATATLANGWTIKRSLVDREPRMELLGPTLSHQQLLENDGVYRANIQYKMRYFIPSGEKGVEVLKRITDQHPVTSVNDLADDRVGFKGDINNTSISQLANDLMNDDAGLIDLTKAADLIKEKAAVVGEGAKYANDAIGRLSGQHFPTSTRLDRETGEKMSQHIGSRLFAKVAADKYADDVLGANSTEDFNKLVGSTMLEMRARHNGKDGKFQTPAEHQAALANPAVRQAIELYKQKYVPEKSDIYRMSQGINQNDPINSQTQIPDMPIYAVNLDEAPSGKGPGNSLKNLRMKANPMARQATLEGTNYETDLRKIIERDLAVAYPIATKAEAARQAEASGLAHWEVPGQKIEGYREVPFSRPPRGTQNANQGEVLYVADAVHGEWLNMLNVAPVDGYKQVIAGLSRPLTALSLKTLAEATGHGGNLITAMMTKPSGAWHGGVVDLANNMYGRLRGTKEAQAKLMELARISALKEPGMEAGTLGKLDPSYWMGKGLDAMSDITRMTMHDWFHRQVAKGTAVNTMTNERNFINESVGNYFKQAQNGLVRWFRETGLGPFATAGTTFAKEGVKSLALGTNLQATGFGSGVKMRAEVFGKMAAVIGAGLAYNLVKWGRIDGDDNTPPLAIKLGNDSQGRTISVDMSWLTGIPRGLRSLGILGYWQGQRQGKTGAESFDKGVETAARSVMHPFEGPLVQAAHTALTGKDAIDRQIAEKPGPGGSQYVQNAKSAAANAFPPYAAASGANQPVDRATGLHRDVPAGERALGMLGRLAPRFNGYDRTHNPYGAVLDKLRGLDASAGPAYEAMVKHIKEGSPLPKNAPPEAQKVIDHWLGGYVEAAVAPKPKKSIGMSNDRFRELSDHAEVRRQEAEKVLAKADLSVKEKRDLLVQLERERLGKLHGVPPEKVKTPIWSESGERTPFGKKLQSIR